MEATVIQKLAATPLLQAPAPSRLAAPEQSDADQVLLGARPEASAARPSVALTSEKAAEGGDRGLTLPVWARVVAGSMAGLMGMVALTGCGPRPPVPAQGADTQEVAQAKERLAQAFTDIEKSMESARGEGKEQSEAVTRQLMDAVSRYSKETGRGAQQVASDLTQFMKDHPAVTLTVAFTVGTAAGIGLEKIGLTDGVSSGLAAIKQAVKDHPFLAGLIVTGIAAGTAYVVYQYVQAEQPAAAAPVPDTPASRELQASLDGLEKQIEQTNPSTPEEARAIQQTFGEQVKEYARKSGRSAAEVASDVKAWLTEHPAVAAAIVMAAGVGTGVVLERAGVPAAVADAIGSVLEGGRNGLGRVGETIKEHPYLSGAIAVGLAAGAGYVIYEYVWPDAPAPPAPAASTPVAQPESKG